MSLVLMTREDLDTRALAHYRTPGSKNGVRLYQYKDGSLTPLGRIHYGVGQAKRAAKEEVKGFAKVRASKDSAEKAGAKADVYKARSEREKDKAVDETNNNNADAADKHTKKAAEFEALYNKYKDKEAKLKERDEKRDRSEAEIKKDIDEKVKNFNETVQAKKQERAEKNEARNKQLKEELSEIRSLTDMELNERITRLQKEKQYSELLNERANREKGPLQAMASKLFKEAAENLARKALNQAGDEVLKKLLSKGKNGNNDQNAKSKDNDKEPDKSNKPDSSKGQDNSSPSNSGGKFTKGEKAQIRSMAASGKSIADIASSLGVTEDKVKGFMKSAGITIS